MSWETRNGKGRYYVRTWREGGRIVREYIGAGAYGECIAGDDARARAWRAEDAAAARGDRLELAELDVRVAAYAKAVKAAAHEALTAAGYQRHQRGEWRKTRAQA